MDGVAVELAHADRLGDDRPADRGRQALAERDDAVGVAERRAAEDRRAPALGKLDERQRVLDGRSERLVDEGREPGRDRRRGGRPVGAPRAGADEHAVHAAQRVGRVRADPLDQARGGDRAGARRVVVVAGHDPRARHGRRAVRREDVRHDRRAVLAEPLRVVAVEQGRVDEPVGRVEPDDAELVHGTPGWTGSGLSPASCCGALRRLPAELDHRLDARPALLDGLERALDLLEREAVRDQTIEGIGAPGEEADARLVVVRPEL